MPSRVNSRVAPRDSLRHCISPPWRHTHHLVTVWQGHLGGEMPEQSDVDKLADLFAGNMANTFKEAAAYNSIIIAAGFAGAFALWNVVKGQLSDFASGMVVVLLGTSLTGYIGWTVFLMVWNVRQIQTYDRSVRGKPPKEYVEAYKKATADARIEHQRIFLKAWILQFVIVLATGMIGMAILLGNAATVLLTNH